MTRNNCYLITSMSTKVNVIPFNWAIKIAATASYNAVPSMLIVAPIGRTNL